MRRNVFVNFVWTVHLRTTCYLLKKHWNLRMIEIQEKLCWEWSSSMYRFHTFQRLILLKSFSRKTLSSSMGKSCSPIVKYLITGVRQHNHLVILVDNSSQSWFVLRWILQNGQWGLLLGILDHPRSFHPGEREGGLATLNCMLLPILSECPHT